VNTSTTLQTKPVVAWDSYTETYTSNHGKIKNRLFLHRNLHIKSRKIKEQAWDSYTETYTSNHGKIKNRPGIPTPKPTHQITEK
jgi:hypothetical protein